jgi:hypothetical protein
MERIAEATIIAPRENKTAPQMTIADWLGDSLELPKYNVRAPAQIKTTAIKSSKNLQRFIMWVPAPEFSSRMQRILSRSKDLGKSQAAREGDFEFSARLVMIRLDEPASR